MKIKGVDITKNDGLQAALADGNWAQRRFGGMWQGLIYAVIVSGAYLFYQAVDDLTATIPWVLCGIMFYAIVAYDSTMVHLWNYIEKDRILADYIKDNLEDLLDNAEVLDSIDDLDGTNGDE